MMNFKNFLQNEQASMTLEFVVVFPLLLVWVVGSVVFFDAYKARADADLAAYAIADILSRHKTLDMEDLELAKNLHTFLLPKADGALWIRVSTIVYDADSDSYSVDFSKVPDSLVGDAMEDDEIPIDLLWIMSDQEMVILVDTVVPYVPLVDWVSISERDWESRVFISPRTDPKIYWCGESGASEQCAEDVS